VNTPLSDTDVRPPLRLDLLSRLGIIIAFLSVETLLISGLLQGPSLDRLVGAAKLIHDAQHWVFRFIVAYCGSLAVLLYLRHANRAVPILAAAAGAPMRVQWLVAHGLLIIPFAVLSTVLYENGAVPFPVLAVAWHACGFAAALALFAAAAPFPVWLAALREAGKLPAYALLPAGGALLAFKASQMLWTPAATLTFRLVRVLALPFSPSLHADASTLTLITGNFEVQISQACSGLEGVGLMLAFCSAWLWYFRREYIFPRALLILPGAVVLIFLLNAVRIAALILIGDAGYQRIATVGFHSQAGWIAFNLAAFGVAVFARRSAWINHSVLRTEARNHDATAAYLMPLLAILASGMVVHALSAGFDLLYPVKLICAAIVLWVYRRSYQHLDWNFTWRGVSVGVLVFIVWAGCAHFMTAPQPIAADLSLLSAPLRVAWIMCRAAAAIVTVPIAEELAYRGYLMRRFLRREFDSLPLRNVTWPALAASAIAFGVMHGSLWFPGIVAGLAYGALAMKTGKIGESVVAHAATNALVAIQVLLFGQWQLW
jgi:exosortase E/protease (VPEID-CTERM system)